MVDMQPKSAKLKDRAIRLIQLLGGTSRGRAAQLLKKSGGNSKTAILMAKRKINKVKALTLLFQTDGDLREALKN